MTYDGAHPSMFRVADPKGKSTSTRPNYLEHISGSARLLTDLDQFVTLSNWLATSAPTRECQTLLSIRDFELSSELHSIMSYIIFIDFSNQNFCFSKEITSSLKRS